MLGVLVVILCSDCVADLSFGASERQIPLIVFLRVLRMPEPERAPFGVRRFERPPDDAAGLARCSLMRVLVNYELAISARVPARGIISPLQPWS
jgi:hypothetical protein